MTPTDPNSITELIHQVAMEETNLINQQLKSLGLNNQQARLLKYVSEHPGSIQKDVAAFLGRQTATLTNMLKPLTQQGYISRKIPDDNERQKQLFIEPKGTQALTLINEIFNNLEAMTKSVISQDEQAAFINTLKQLVTAYQSKKK